jgi:DNA repair protein SbcD/Mre11
MKIVHTSDWHLGQLFKNRDRTHTHELYLQWQLQYLIDNEIDVLLISGDVFDVANPSSASIKQLYTFLNNATTALPNLQIIITAGNHDSAAGLERPMPFLENSNITIIGSVPYNNLTQTYNFNSCIIPLKNKNNNTVAQCLAIPFIRYADMPDSNYEQNVNDIYKQGFEFIRATSSLPVIAMGHLTVLGSSANIMDAEAEKAILIGGQEGISVSNINAGFAYVALGHIHKAQHLGEHNFIRYSGSPIPLSFTEVNYKHSITVFEIINNNVENITKVPIPIEPSLIRVPDTFKPLDEVLQAIEALPNITEKQNITQAPFIEVQIILPEPDPFITQKIEEALQNKYAQLVSIKRETKTKLLNNNATENKVAQLKELSPLDIAKNVYAKKYEQPMPQALIELFTQVYTTVSTTEI